MYARVPHSLTDNNLFDCDFSLPSGSPNPALLQDNPQSMAHPATTTTLVMSPRNVHGINIGNIGGIVSSPPPLIPAEFGQSISLLQLQNLWFHSLLQTQAYTQILWFHSLLPAQALSFHGLLPTRALWFHSLL